MRKILFTSLAVTALVCVAQIALAQGPPPPLQTPIDGGLSLIIAGGIAYAAKKANDKRKNNEA